MDGATLKAKVTAALVKVNATDRALYKRVYSHSGGDSLIGKPATVTAVDTLFTTPPAIQTLTSENMTYLSVSGLAQVGDLILTLSASAIALADLKNRDLRLVLKTGSSEEELAIVHYEPALFDGMCVAYTVLARSKKR